MPDTSSGISSSTSSGTPDGGTARLLDPRAIRLDARATGREDAVRQCGRALADVGAVTAGYVDSMLERERSLSTHLGEGVAIPHGTAAGKDAVLRDALAVLRFPGGVDWDGHPVTVCIAIAARGDGHMAILTELAQILMDPGRARRLREAATAEEVIRLLRPEQQGTTP
ncbi:PTS system IIA component, Fru family [Thermomonospora echinospora]|uniref:Mannitol-specific phosphotransferase enzyme IIA component n=1 Tax=Thermomonospora echinospora TaxID=1992 RepID=A0A1H6E261_9ACTN|nr:PTS sugar transporter subunit IIA [Thermomonospora echinospora]SEG91224.1 PTS system IIA component, Fru family [Thermomonospora echinospora]